MLDRNTPFWDASLPIEKRLDWLLSEMTIEEKLSCLASRVPNLERLGIPAMSVGGEAAHGVEARNDQNGLGAPDVSTSFVQPIGMSATWDTGLIRQAGTVTGIEGRVIYHRHPGGGLSRWAPTVDLERDPRWGRTEEGYGEDPVLTGEMASAYIKGMQGDDPQYLRVAATLKHFYGNNTEIGRGWKNSSIDPRNKNELYLEPFRRCIEKGGAEAVMTAYNKINGVPGILNREVQDILKEEYGLGHAVSDGGAMGLVASYHHYYGTNAETVANALRAGVDVMSDDPQEVGAAAKEAWDLGLMTEADVDRALRNVFRTKLRLGIYDNPVRNPYDRVTEADIDSEQNRSICRQVSREAIVLLKNEKHMLPLDSGMSPDDIALIGPMADAWYMDWYGGTAPFRKTLKDGVEEVLGEAARAAAADGSVSAVSDECADGKEERRKVAVADGLDRVVLRCCLDGVQKGVAVGDDGILYLSDTPDVFIRQDWGEGSITFRSVRNGKFMNARLDAKRAEDVGILAAEKDEPSDWFVMEIFHELPCEDGSVILTNRFDSPVQVCEDGHLRSMRPGEGTPVRVEVVEDGAEKALRLAAEKKVVILALGCCPMINAKEEIDRTTLALPPAQEALQEAVYKVNPNMVLVLFSNYPYTINRAQETLPAILWSATGAQDMGLAMAETLFGQNAPAGRLNLTWYADDSQLSDTDDYDIIKGNRTYRYFPGDVLYPFGYGLTYTTFAYSDLQAELLEETKIKATVAVTNTGTYISDEVVQIYGIAPASRVKKPLRQLLAFQRLKAVKPGEGRTAEFVIPIEELRFYDVISGTLMVEKGCYTIFAGPSSAEDALSVKLDIPGLETGTRDLSKRIRADHYDDYENIELVEGQYGFTAVTPVQAAMSDEAVLIYRDCCLEAGMRVLHLHAMSETGGRILVSVNDRQVASWEGNTRTYERVPYWVKGEKDREDMLARMDSWKAVYADICLELPGMDDMSGVDDLSATCKTVTLQIRMTGDVKLCWFRAEKN